ncbi:transmembrane protein 41B isoform X2 [Atheta coriaria]|uniref:transmembrane protein 41B isoform X2 n=1 Tax=Dalotia coriaria TaxID=877792 RepID=UPI0031F3C059
MVTRQHVQDVNSLKKQSDSTRTSVIALGGIFITTLAVLWWIYNGFPELQEEEKQHIKIPWNLEDAKNLGTVLYRYKGDHFYHVYFGVSIMYIFLQTFAIPGSLFLSVLSGFLFSFPQAMFLVSTCSAVGASLCFLISHLLGRRIIYKYFPEKAAAWGTTVAKHSDNLLNYVIFLRVTPFLPNWFINLTAPVIGVPLRPFALGTLLGVMPPSFVALQAGQTLHSMSADDAKVSWTSMSLLIAFGFVALLPIYFKDRLRKKFE